MGSTQKDYSQAHDLAKQMPDKVRALWFRGKGFGMEGFWDHVLFHAPALLKRILGVRGGCAGRCGGGVWGGCGGALRMRGLQGVGPGRSVEYCKRIGIHTCVLF